MEEWAIGVESWIIQDGNYSDFARGEKRKFAVEFYFADLTLADTTRPARELIVGCAYSLTAVVTGTWDKAWVIDCGISAFRDATPPKGVATADVITGRATLGIDPYFYVEHLHRLPGMPLLVYTWHINRISRETTPWTEAAPRLWQRDPKRIGFEDVERTDAWQDDEGNAFYVLHCALLDVPPTANLASP